MTNEKEEGLTIEKMNKANEDYRELVKRDYVEITTDWDVPQETTEPQKTINDHLLESFRLLGYPKAEVDWRDVRTVWIWPHGYPEHEDDDPAKSVYGPRQR